MVTTGLVQQSLLILKGGGGAINAPHDYNRVKIMIGPSPSDAEMFVILRLSDDTAEISDLKTA